MLGDATKVEVRAAAAAATLQRAARARGGAIDLLVASAANTLREQATGCNSRWQTTTIQAVVVAKKLDIARVAALRGSTVCVLKGTAHEANLKSWFGARRLSIVTLSFDDQNAMSDAFLAGRCDAVTEGSTALWRASSWTDRNSQGRGLS